MSVAFDAWGSLALFPDPLYKPDRRSYPFIPPTAAKGLVESIFHKPQMEWEIVRLALLAEIRFAPMGVTNGFDDFPTEKVFATFRRTGVWHYSLEGEMRKGNRIQQRNMVLVEPAYRIEVRAVVKPGVDAKPIKYEVQLARRVERGGFWKDVYFGAREFQAYFGPPRRPVVDVSMDLGIMPVTINYAEAPFSYRPAHFRLVRGILEEVPNGS